MFSALSFIKYTTIRCMLLDANQYWNSPDGHARHNTKVSGWHGKYFNFAQNLHPRVYIYHFQQQIHSVTKTIEWDLFNFSPPSDCFTQVYYEFISKNVTPKWRLSGSILDVIINVQMHLHFVSKKCNWRCKLNDFKQFNSSKLSTKVTDT